MKQPHKSQLQILKKLGFAKELRYTDLKPSPEMENNLFDFHLDSLITDGYVKKDARYYSLTDSGKEFVNRLDMEQEEVSTQPKIIVTICCVTTVKNSRMYLIHSRKKQPFYGQQGFPGGKVKFGEKIVDAARRELKEETNLGGRPEVVAIRHYVIREQVSEKLLDDFYIYLCTVHNPIGKLKPNLEGSLEWVSEQELRQNVTHHIESYSSFIEQINLVKKFRGQINFQEIDLNSRNF